MSIVLLLNVQTLERSYLLKINGKGTHVVWLVHPFMYRVLVKLGRLEHETTAQNHNIDVPLHAFPHH